MTKNIVIIALVALVVGLGAGIAFTPSESNLGSLSQLVTKTASLEVTGNTTMAGDLVLNQGPFCIDFYATSTATRNKVTASTTATIEGVDGVLMFEYGSCQ